MAKVQASQADPNYWNVVFGMLILMFVAYITARGELGIWIQLFFYREPTMPQQSIGDQPASTPIAAGTNLTAPITGGPSVAGTLFGRLFGGLPSSGLIGGGPPV